MSRVSDRLRQLIRKGGSLPFASFMEEALYGEQGYYSRPELPIGRSGDFVTGSSLSPIFGRATARLMRRLDALLSAPAELLEVGYGSGVHLRSVVEELRGAPRRRILAHDRIVRPVPVGVEVCKDLQQLQPGSLRGLVFSYELFDALPVHRLIGRADGSVGELWVDLDRDDSFRYVEGQLSDPALRELLDADADSLLPGQIADLSPFWRPLYRRLADTLQRGLVVTCDYGFERRRLLDARVRLHGTLACFRDQKVHRDALASVGTQDLTAHVDFTALRDEGEAAGLGTVAFTRQARWLLACGIFDQLREADQATRLLAMDLLNPAGMGEEIRVLVQARGLAPETLFDLTVLGSPSP